MYAPFAPMAALSAFMSMAPGAVSVTAGVVVAIGTGWVAAWIQPSTHCGLRVLGLQSRGPGQLVKLTAPVREPRPALEGRAPLPR